MKFMTKIEDIVEAVAVVVETTRASVPKKNHVLS